MSEHVGVTTRRRPRSTVQAAAVVGVLLGRAAVDRR
jgi:hypothetical protein